jgi:3-oxoacyl-[acyl-carrier protein] reductase
MLTPGSTVRGVFDTNYLGTFLFCREAAKLMQANHDGRIVNFVSTTVPLKWEGAAVYASSKAAVLTLTQIMAREVADVGITVNAVAPPVISTELGRAVPEDKIHSLLDRHAIKRLGEFSDVANVVDFFIKPESALVTGQVIFLGGA